MAIFKSSLAFRLTVWFLLLSFFPLAVVAIFVLDDVDAGFDQLILDHQRSQTEMLAAILSSRPLSEASSILHDNFIQNEDFFIINPSGQYQHHQNANKITAFMNNDFSPEVVELVLTGESGVTTEAGTGRIIGFAPIPNQSAIMVTVLEKSPAADLVSSIRRSSQIQLAASLAIMSITGGLAIWIVVGNPVRQLTEAARQISQGNLTVEVDPEETADELQVLARTFNQMTGQLRTLISGLEQKVAELEEAEQTIRASEEYNRALIENAQDIITVLDEDGTIRFESPAIKWALGYEPEELVGKSVFDYVHSEDQGAVLDVFQQGIQEKDEPQRIELRFKHRDSSWRYLEAIGQNLLDNPVVRGAVVNSRDITERKQLEDRLRQAQKMEAIGRLAGGIAHDFNNLLVPIIGYVEMAMMKLPPDVKPYANLKRVREAANRAADLTQQILAFSRKQLLDMRVFDLNTVVADFEKMIQRLIGEDIKLQTFLDSDLYRVKADKGQIEQVLLNLVVNARDAMPTGGKLTIETANAYLDEAYIKKYSAVLKPGDYIMMAISDTGQGMDARTQQQIFEPFFTTKGPGEGTGLGLATVFGIIKQHGGHIGVYSEPGNGAIFKIYLPKSEDATQTYDSADAKPATLFGTDTVLVVEDDEMVRNLVCETLAVHGYNVIDTQSATQGLQRAFEYREAIDLLLTDVVLPEMNGQELYKNMITIYPAIKVLYMSGYTDNVIVHHGVLDERINFLKKPFTIHNLTQKVRQVLSSEAHP